MRDTTGVYATANFLKTWGQAMVEAEASRDVKLVNLRLANMEVKSVAAKYGITFEEK